MRGKEPVFVFIPVLLLCTLLVTPSPPVSGQGEGSSLRWDFAAATELASLAYTDENSIQVIIGEVRSTQYSKLQELIVKHGGKVVNRVISHGVEEAITVDMPLVSVSSFVAETQAAQISEYVEPNLRFEAQLVPDDPYFPEQWGLTKIEAPRAWDLGQGDSSVLVAVVDSGIDWNHPDLVQNYVPLGYDWVNDDENPMDDNGHGTHVAGIIAAALDNELGVAGVAQISIMAEKSLDRRGGGYVDDLASAVFHATEQGADIISMSWGDYEDSWLLHRALIEAYYAGVLLVAAAGNDATSERMYPAAYDEVIAVAATDQSDNPASFTNYGNWIELSAPGVNVFSTLWNDGFGYKSGTSMATPFVSGVAALVWSLHGDKTRDELRSWLQSKSDDLGELGFDFFYGYGRINAKKAVSIPNIAVTQVSLPKSIVGQGFAIEVMASVANLNLDAESFDLTVYLNSTVLQVGRTTLAGLSSTAFSITWNTDSYMKGSYLVSVYATPIPEEAEIDDNSFVGGWVLVTIVGDVNGDLKVNIFDMTMIARVYGTLEGESAYNPNCDIDGNRRIDIFDVVNATGNYGRAAP